MRRKNKLICDECLSFIEEINKEKMEKINKDRLEGTRTNCSAICGKCKYRILTGKFPK